MSVHRRSASRTAPARRARRITAAGGLVVVSALSAACGSSGASSSAAPTWVPAQTVEPVPLPTAVAGGGDTDGGSGSDGGGSGGGSGSTTSTAPSEPSTPASPGSTPSSGTPSAATAATDPNVVARNLNAPTGLVVLPDGTALVGERTTGRILQVQPVAGHKATAVKTLTGLDTARGGGLLDLALSATYGEDGLVLALISTRTDLRVVHFTLDGPVTPILTGIPRPATVTAGRLLVRSDGNIMVGTPAVSAAGAADPKNLAGKVLRISDIGRPASGNPHAGSRVYASGLSRVDGLCTAVPGATGASVAATFAVQGGSSDRISVVKAGGGYGAGAPTAARPTVTGGITDCAVVGSTLYVTGLGGKDVFGAPVSSTGTVGKFGTGQLHGKYGRLRTVVAGADGSLWLTTSNRDGHGVPARTDERVLHIKPSGGGGAQNRV